MTFIPFGGFFFAAMPATEELAALEAHFEMLESHFPEYFQGGKVTPAGLATKDNSFHDALEAHGLRMNELRKGSFFHLDLEKPGMVLKVKSVPGGANYEYFGDKIRTHVLGGILGEQTTDHDQIAADDIIVGYLDLSPLFPD